MSRAYLVIVDRQGLRALLPEDDDGYRIVRAFSGQLTDAACYWATMSMPDAVDVCRQLNELNAVSACRTVCQRAEFLGRVSQPLELSHAN